MMESIPKDTIDNRTDEKAVAGEEKEENKIIDRFRTAGRRYKLYKGKDKRRRITDFSDVIDITPGYNGTRAVRVNVENIRVDVENLPGNSAADSSRDSKAGKESGTDSHAMNRLEAWRIPEVEDGFFVVKNALSVEDQAKWAIDAVKKFSVCAHTNLTNLHGPQPDHWADMLKSNKGFDKTSGFAKLRWASLGYHYDWTNRIYHKNTKSDFPPELAALATKLAGYVGFKLKSEAAILNFYPYDGAMGGHVDDAEMALSYPIVSISLGCTAVFLIGATNKQIEPTAVFLKSGDAVIMGGKSRMCYHGIPRIVQGTCPALVKHLQSSNTEETKLLAQYIDKSRININVRQVVDETNNFDSAPKPVYPRT